MDKKIVGLLGAVAGLATAGSAQAATHEAINQSEAPNASSYADLLSPIPDAVAQLRADDAARAQARVEPAASVQFSFGNPYGYTYSEPYPYRYPYPRYEHHHHHQQQYYRYYR